MFMRSRRLAPFALLLTLGVAACGGDAPTAPAATATDGVASVAPTQQLAAGCPFTASQLDQLLLDALPNGLENAATSRFDNIEKTYDSFKLTLAQDKARELIAWLEKKYADGQFTQGTTTAAQLQLLQLKTAILCLVGLPYPTSIDVGNQTIGFAYPSVDVTIARGDKQAGTVIPAGAVSQITKITIAERTEPLPTDLTQYPSFFQLTAEPAAPFNVPVTVGVCLDGKPPAGTDIRLARGTGPNVGDIEILPEVPLSALSFLDCGDDTVLPDALPAAPFPHPQISALDRASFFLARLTPRITGAVADMLLPAPAHATALLRCCTLGGAAGSFSPFGGVDINSATIEAVGPTSVTGPANSTATVKVRLKNRERDIPLRGEDVSFAVSGGTVTPANVRTAASPADGLATATWTLGAGATTLTVRGFIGRIPLGTSASTRIQIPGSPITYAGTGTVATSFGFGASGWTVNSYTSATALEAALIGLKQGTESGTLAQAGFSDALAANTCAVYGPTTLKSATFPLNGYVAIRREFIAPGGAAQAVLKISIDNDFKVYLNGAEITGNVTGLRNGGTGTFTSQFQEAGWFLHDGCPGGTASGPTGDFDVPLTGLSPISNEILIIGRDRGSRSYLDAAIVSTVP